jgi:hypothetical protein
MLKYLRIAVTALSLTASVLLIALWVRSRWWIDLAYGYLLPPSHFELASVDGNIEVGVFSLPIGYQKELGFASLDKKDYLPVTYRVPTWRVVSDKYYAGAACPIWFAVLLSGTFALVPWLPWSRRFSLRTLLIATTLVAVALAVILYAT